MRVKARKAVILGPECTGKSELSEYLAAEFNTIWVEEYAREYLDALGRPYTPEDLNIIARGQTALENSRYPQANRVLICDTNLYVIKVWSEFKYGYCDPEILNGIKERHYDLYLLTYVDIPWIADPLREHPGQRHELYSIYLREMQNQPVPFVEIKGNREQRRRRAKESVLEMLEGQL